MNDHPLAAWPALRIGDRALIRERDTARELAVTVVTLLDPLEGEGDGFVDHRGRVIRHHFYDARPIAPDPELTDQRDVDDRFAQLTAPLTTGELRLLHKALEIAAGYANTERDESTILELSARIRRAQKTIPSAPDAHTTVLATIDAVKRAGRYEKLTPEILDRIADELLRETPL